jgi:hypothetical protein
MKNIYRYLELKKSFVTIAIILLFSYTLFAQDDGARAYWKGRAGTNAISVEYMPAHLGASNSLAFAPGQYIYPNAETDANIFIATWAHHLTIFNRPSSIAVNLIGGSIDVSVNTIIPTELVPEGFPPTVGFSQASSGFSDPNMQLVVNLLGTPKLLSNVDLLNYEPTFTIDIAGMLSFPVGQYNEEKLVNIGLNRWYGRIAIPMKYHFGVFSPGYMSSLEIIPAAWLFTENSDFMGQKLENKPLWSVEAHLTHDLSPSLFVSIDMLYQTGFESEIDGNEVGEKLEIGQLGFSFNYQVTDNVSIRTGYSSNVFGDANLETSAVRLQFVYAWHTSTENAKKLSKGH